MFVVEQREACWMIERKERLDRVLSKRKSQVCVASGLPRKPTHSPQWLMCRSLMLVPHVKKGTAEVEQYNQWNDLFTLTIDWFVQKNDQNTPAPAHPAEPAERRIPGASAGLAQQILYRSVEVPGVRQDLLRALLTWGICTRRAGKLYKALSRLYRSQFCKSILVGKLSPRSTQCTVL